MQIVKSFVFLLTPLCVVFILWAYSYVRVSSQPIVVAQAVHSAVHEPGSRPQTHYPCGFALVLRYAGQQGAIELNTEIGKSHGTAPDGCRAIPPKLSDGCSSTDERRGTRRQV